MTIRLPDCKRPVHPLDDDPVRRRIAACEADRSRARQAFEKLKVLRKTTTLGGSPWKELRDEGRP
jgi:hypothetical protein